jgi:hypothetical protein
LFSTPTGKVNTSHADELNVALKNQELFKEKVVLRNKFAQQSIYLRKQKIESLLGITPNLEKLEIENIADGKIGRFDTKFNHIILRKKGEFPLPISIYYPTVAAKSVVIWVTDDAKRRNSMIIQSLTDKSEEIIISVDLRGTGETTDNIAFNDPKYFSKDYRNAMLALHIGKPLVGQRVQDILNVIDFIKTNADFKELPITINSLGLVGVSTLHAAFLNPKINKVNLFQCINSYQDVLNQPLAKDRYGAVIANVLSYYDIPALIDWIGLDKVKIHP